MPKPESLNTWSALTRKDRRRFQFKPGNVAPGLQGQVVGLKAYIGLPEYEGPNPNIPQMIVRTAYEGGNSYVKYFNSIDIELSRVDRMEERGKKSGFTVTYNEHPSLPRDYLTKKYGPLSLDDLARLPNQLSREDLQDIFEFWISLGWKSTLNRKDRSKNSALHGLVGNFITGTDNGSRPNRRIQRIRASLLAPLRFYREHLLNFSSDEDIDLLVKTFPDHIDTLALIYSFETSGISLSSIQKLLIQRRQQLAKADKVPLYKKLMLRTIGSITNLAIADIKNYKPLNTPWVYLFYEPELDRPVEETLESNYDLVNSAKDGLEKDYEKTQQLIDSWLQYHARITTLLTTDPINITIDEHSYISNIRLMARTKESTHFVLFFKTSGLYLTLDIDSKGRLFGLPPNLAVRFPHADFVIFGDVLSTLIPKLEKMFPGTAEEIRRKNERKAEKAMLQLQEPPILPLETQLRIPINKIEREDVITLSKTPKRKSLPRENFMTESKLSPETEFEVSVTRPTRIVDYSEESVKTLAGKRASQEHIGQLMNTIRRFEFGIDSHLAPVHARELGAQGARLLRLRTGRWRIFLEHQGHNAYRVTQIARRDHAYSTKN